MYHDGASEEVLGKALKGGYREKVLLADKFPVWLADDGQEALFDRQRRRLDTDFFDMYLVHNLTARFWEQTLDSGLLSFLEKKRAEGKIGHIGFSFHDELPVFQKIVDSYPWDFCQIQLNFMDVAYQAGLEGLRYAAAKGLPVIVMEPLKGGKLTDALPPSVAALWRTAPLQRTPADWALRWVADFPEVLTILSGIHSMAQLDENLATLSDADAGKLTDAERRLIEAVSAEYNRLIHYSCTACRYCLPCTKKIDIPAVIDFRNAWEIFGHNEKTRADFGAWISPRRYPSVCSQCGVCEGKCPQHLPIIQIMEEGAAIFG
jgi:predicted aldo/keto reductase-like oxidoreductase